MRIGLAWIVMALTWTPNVGGDALGNHPDVVRLYLFDDVSAGTREIPSVAGEKEPLRPGGDGPLAVVDGRVPGKKAVRLDRGFLAAKPFAVEDTEFSVEMWIRHHGQGSLLGNGQPNGMLFAQGDGYWSGERMMLDTPSRRLSFMIGRPRPSRAVGVSAGQLVPEGAWHHLAATWDGREMRIYWNGMLVGAAPYDGQYTAPGGPLKIGYANAGVGSLELDVDELAVFGRALRAEEILAHALDGVELPAPTLTRLVEANAALLRGEWDAAKAGYEAVLKEGNVSPQGRSVAQFGLGQARLRQGKNVEGGRRLAALLRDPAVPEGLREAAVREFLSDEPEAVQAAAPAEVYQRLVELPDLDASDRITVRLCLAECYLREKRPALARAEFDAVLKSDQLDRYRRWDVRLKRAHTYLAAKEYGRARAEYDGLAAGADVPPEVSIHAMLASGHALYRERAYGAAAERFDRTARLTNAPAYLCWEAAERAEEMRRLARGLPGRDPKASRVKLSPQPEPGVTLYVAPDGKADNPGTKDRPLATLTQARAAVRKLRAEAALPPGGVTVFIRGGAYSVDETFELSREDSGTEKSPIVYRAFPGERPVFRGGVRLRGFVRATDPGALRRLPEEARGRVVQLDLKKAGVTDLGRITARGYGRCAWGRALWVDLYVNGRPMQLARWPNEGFLEMGRVLDGAYRSDGAGKPGRFTYEGDRPKRWTEADDAWTFGYWTHLWAGTYQRIASIDTGARVIATSSSSTGGFRAGYPYYVVNLLEELDRPGEWYLDRKSRVVYLWPPADLSEAVVEFPVLEEPFVSIEEVSHVTLRGLTFELGRGDGIGIAGGNRVLLAGCTIRRLGGNAVAVEGGTDCGVLGCDIHTVGARGVILRGGALKSLTPGRHFVENCHIHDFTRVDRVYAPAVHLFGVGNRVAHNLLCDSPHHAIRLEGHEHLVELNEIHSVVYESDDQAGIDVWGSPILRGNVIRYNFWHHIGSGRDVAGQSGIRLDDMISTFVVYGNVFYRAAGGRFGAVQIHGGKDNAVDNNLFVDCQAAVSFSPWGEKRWKDRLVDPGWRNRALAGGIDITKPPFSTRYPDLAHMEENADRNFLRRNLVVDCARVKLRDRGVNLWLDNLQLCDDPGFADRPGHDFTLPDDSSVYDRFGFRPIPFREIGLYQDPYRATWPVEQEISPHYVAE